VGQVGWGEILVLLVIGLFVFGPERLPTIARDVARTVRQLRRMAKDAADDIKSELGPEVADLDLASLHPRRLVQDHLLRDDDDEEPEPPRARPRPSLDKPAVRPLPNAPARTVAPGTPYDADAT
jgi:sec-independent protein translocase protein TatB